MLTAFRAYLGRTAVVQSKYIPFYVKWVAGCYSFLDKRESEVLNPQDRERFLGYLSKAHEDWQVNQANSALRVYNFFLSSQMKGPLENEAGAGDAWVALEARTIEALRIRQRAYSTEKTYLVWLRAFQRFLENKNPTKIDGQDIQRFLSHLAVERRVSASTQNQALNALIFIYRHALDKTLGEKELNAVRARQKRRLPVVLTVREVQALFDNLSGIHRLMAKLIYGCGFRLRECLSLRLKDLDLEQNVIIIRSGKGDKDRRTVLPRNRSPLIHAR